MKKVVVTALGIVGVVALTGSTLSGQPVSSLSFPHPSPPPQAPTPVTSAHVDPTDKTNPATAIFKWAGEMLPDWTSMTADLVAIGRAGAPRRQGRARKGRDDETDVIGHWMEIPTIQLIILVRSANTG